MVCLQRVARSIKNTKPAVVGFQGELKIWKKTKRR